VNESEPFRIEIGAEEFDRLESVAQAQRVNRLRWQPRPLTASEVRRRENAVERRRAKRKAAKAARRRNRQ